MIAPLAVPVLPAAPENFQHSFLISQANITARLRWRPPLPSPPGTHAPSPPVTGYRIVWGTALEAGMERGGGGDGHEEVDREMHPQLDHSKALTKVLGRVSNGYNGALCGTWFETQ
jgi:hypothetical protein